MYVPSTSDTRVNSPPEVFTNKARLEVINNLANNNNNNNNSNNNTTSHSVSNNNAIFNRNNNRLSTTAPILPHINDLNKSRSRTSSLLPSFFGKSTTDQEKDVRISDAPSSPTQQSSTASSLRSSIYSSLLPSYQQLTTPASRTVTRNSIDSSSSGSIFSSLSSLKSVSTSASSITDSLGSSEKMSLPSISSILKSNIPEDKEQGQEQGQQQHHIQPSKKQKHDTIPKGDIKTISLERAISDIKDYNALMHQNVGYEVFLQLNEAIAEILKTENLQLIDWNLNLIRCSLIVNLLPPTWNNEIPAITVNGTMGYKIQDGFQSELVKLISSYRRQQKNHVPTTDLNFKKFIKSVLQNRFLLYEKNGEKTTIRFNKNIKEDVIRIQLVPSKCSEDEFIDFLTSSDLFKEFNLEEAFKRKVATISIKQSKFLQSLKTKGSDELLHPYKILSLRNYFLNLLVASQTLFEFHYTVNELLGKEKKDKEISDDELRWLWDNIRERNFKKIEIFDRFY